MIEKITPDVFKIHFYLENSKHSIKDGTFINSHTEFSAYVKELTRFLGVNINIEILPCEEGGFKHCIKLIGENSAALTIISGIIIAVFSGTAWSLYQRPLLNQQAEINKTDIEIKKLELEKLKIELARLKKLKPRHQQKATPQSLTQKTFCFI